MSKSALWEGVRLLCAQHKIVIPKYISKMGDLHQASMLLLNLLECDRGSSDATSVLLVGRHSEHIMSNIYDPNQVSYVASRTALLLSESLGLRPGSALTEKEEQLKQIRKCFSSIGVFGPHHLHLACAQEMWRVVVSERISRLNMQKLPVSISACEVELPEDVMCASPLFFGEHPCVLASACTGYHCSCCFHAAIMVSGLWRDVWHCTLPLSSLDASLVDENAQCTVLQCPVGSPHDITCERAGCLCGNNFNLVCKSCLFQSKVFAQL